MGVNFTNRCHPPTSFDRGTAFDIAGKGIADANSMKAAIELAVDMVKSRMLVKC